MERHRKPTMLLLTNFNHGIESRKDIEEEDMFLADCLKEKFHVIVCHPKDCEAVEDRADIILIRNIWPVFQYEREWEKIKERLLGKRLNVYPPLEAKGDMLGKGHLIELFNLGYPVIPTIDNKKDIGKLPKTQHYFIKPKNKCDAIGAEKISAAELKRRNFRNCVIQPYVDFKYEISFYAIDGKIECAFSTPRKVWPYMIKEYRPTKKDEGFVKKIIDWNSMPYGLQRVDACRLMDGRLLLMELEDFCPYLNLLRWGRKTGDRMLDALIRSVVRACNFGNATC